MDILKTKLGPWAPQILSLIRILTALLFLEHGTVKRSAGRGRVRRP